MMPARRDVGIAPRVLALALSLSSACRASGARPVDAASGGPSPSPRLDLPPALEHERSRYEADVLESLQRVSGFFRSAGFEAQEAGVIESVIVFENLSKAREVLTRELGAPPESIPETFSGTVDGKRLFLVSREAYQAVWSKMYSGWPWTRETYRQLIAHELAHRVHESIAIAELGSAEAMGPPWFFEGLAVACAGQFETDQPLMSRAEVEMHTGAGRTPEVSYPLYGKIVRSLAGRFEMKALIARAAEPGFPQTLWANHGKREPAEK